MNDPVDHPAHYTAGTGVAWVSDPGIECIDVTQHMTMLLGNATKYIWRAGAKNGAREDLEKAVWYLRRQIELLRQQEETPALDPQEPLANGDVRTHAFFWDC